MGFNGSTVAATSVIVAFASCPCLMESFLAAMPAPLAALFEAAAAAPLSYKIGALVASAVVARGVIQTIIDGVLVVLRWRFRRMSVEQRRAYYKDQPGLGDSSVELLAVRALLNGFAKTERKPHLKMWQFSLTTLSAFVPRGREITREVRIAASRGDGGVPAWHVTYPSAPAAKQIIVYFHGGAYLGGSGYYYTPFLGRIAEATGVPALAVDYRLLLNGVTIHDAIDDCIAAIDYAVGDLGHAAGDIIVMGDSAGGGLVLSVLQRLAALKRPKPLCGIPISPLADATGTVGATRKTNMGSDPLVTPAKSDMFKRYLKMSHPDLSVPAMSPLNGDFSGLPPMFITAAAKELLASDAHLATNKARAAGVDVEVYVAETYGLHIDPVFSAAYPEAARTHAMINSYILKRIKETEGGAKKTQ